jgi:hypothetical protein
VRFVCLCRYDAAFFDFEYEFQRNCLAFLGVVSLEDMLTNWKVVACWLYLAWCRLRRFGLFCRCLGFFLWLLLRNGSGTCGSTSCTLSSLLNDSESLSILSNMLEEALLKLI